MARAARLKVYCTPSGFDDALVAAPSQAAALKAWGARGDLFGMGQASVLDADAPGAAEALAKPGEVVRRPRGDLDALASKPAKARTRPKVAASEPAPATRWKPDRGKLDAAEKALDTAQDELDAALSELARERKALDAREARARREGEEKLAGLKRARDREQRAYAKAGGTD